VAYYPNRQDAAMLWYHDHALGINRLNVFAGLFGVFFVRDEFEDALHLPRGKYEIPLVLYDRVLDRESQLNYPISDDEKSPWASEVYGDAFVVNGKIYPYLEVEPCKYRFYHFKFMAEDTPMNHPPLPFQQIGTDQGLLPAPLHSNLMTLAPGERGDLVFDFSASAGSNVYLVNDNEKIVQFRVAAKGAANPSAIPAAISQALPKVYGATGKNDSKDDGVVPTALRPVPKMEESSAVKTRVLSLIEVDDRVGRPMMMLLNNAHWNMPVTENPVLDSVEIWSLVNLTDDAHPIHLHLVKFQILDRRPHDVLHYFIKQGDIRYIGPAMPPDPSEAGWKDTVRVDANTVTRIIVKFEGFVGRYVWHCHLLEHEDNEMMRPFDVVKG
jgi:spore coat protein A, manganese oxidase